MVSSHILRKRNREDKSRAFGEMSITAEIRVEAKLVFMRPGRKLFLVIHTDIKLLSLRCSGNDLPTTLSCIKAELKKHDVQKLQ